MVNFCTHVLDSWEVRVSSLHLLKPHGLSRCNNKVSIGLRLGIELQTSSGVKSVEQKVKSLPSSRIFCRHVLFLSLSPKIVYAWLISGCGFTAPFFFFNQKPKVCMTEVLLVKRKKNGAVLIAV